ncbi:hypothetical protein Tco_1208523 [Tanacetum coccineum]
MDGSGDVEGLTWIFSGLSFSSSLFSFAFSFMEPLVSQIWIVLAVNRTLDMLETVVERRLECTISLDPALERIPLTSIHRCERMRIQQRLVRDLPCYTEFHKDHYRSHMRIDMYLLDVVGPSGISLRSLLVLLVEELCKVTSSKISMCDGLLLEDVQANYWVDHEGKNEINAAKNTFNGNALDLWIPTLEQGEQRSMRSMDNGEKESKALELIKASNHGRRKNKESFKMEANEP